MKIRSPLRYPGGKTRAIKTIDPLIPKYSEYREPFVGGGSVFAHLKQKYSTKKYWINDLNYDLFLFWKYAKESNNNLVNEIRRIKTETIDGRELFEMYKGNWEKYEGLDRAVRFFIVNGLPWPAAIDSGGYSKQSFNKRFTESSIDRVEKLEELLVDTRITNLDYEEVIMTQGEDVFIFLDPPYYSTTNSRLYGKNGDLHASFDHKRFANVMKNCNHKWLITYDDCNEIRNLFNFAEIFPWSLQYGLNIIDQETPGRGKELFIANYSYQRMNFQINLERE